LGSAAALEIAGPGVILSFALAAFITLTVTMALGELSSSHPGAGSFERYGSLYLNRWAGFMAGAGYWAGLSISIGAELVASATYLSYWLPSVPALVWVVIFSSLLLLINLRSVANYARFEYWFAMIKVATIMAFIVLGAALLLSGRVAPQYTAQGGFLPHGPLAPLLAIGFAIYTFAGIEFVAITTGESRSATEIPRAIKLTFAILTTVYLGAIVVLVGVMPWNHAGVTESPFVTTFRTVKIPRASGVMNFVVLTAALSGANATLYVASRMIFSLARTGWAPARLGRLNPEGSPQYAVLLSSFGILFALALVLWAPENAFRYIVGAAFTGMILSWLVSLAAHISFRHRRKPEDLAALPLRSPLGKWGSIAGLILVTIALIQTWLYPIMNLWSGLALLAVLILSYALAKKHRPPP